MTGGFRWRNRALAIAGCRTGLRITEILSWRIGDVLDGRTLRDSIYTRRGSVKGKAAGRGFPLHPEARTAITRWLVDLSHCEATFYPNRPLFGGREGKFSPAISRKSAHRIVAEAAQLAGLPEGISTHSWHKWIAPTVHRKGGHCLINTGAIFGRRQI